METEGITIERLSIGWLQILVGVFALGGFAYTTTQMYTTVSEVKTKQDELYKTYVPMITKVHNEASTTNKAIIDLTTTIQQFNTNLTTILALRKKEEADQAKLVKKVDKLTNEVTDIKIRISSLDGKIKD